MMNRRRVLVAIGMAPFGGVGSPRDFTVLGAEVSNAADDRLKADLTSIGSRVYSEEGVPMFLACENLSGISSASKEAPISSVTNQKVVSALHRYADAWQHVRPDAPSSDVAKILELIADHDFASGGTEVSL